MWKTNCMSRCRAALVVKLQGCAPCCKRALSIYLQVFTPFDLHSKSTVLTFLLCLALDNWPLSLKASEWFGSGGKKKPQKPLTLEGKDKLRFNHLSSSFRVSAHQSNCMQTVRLINIHFICDTSFAWTHCLSHKDFQVLPAAAISIWTWNSWKSETWYLTR